MVEQAPQMLPLAGAPNLAVLGREVQLGANYADLLAVEPSGRLAVIEVKLSRNAEARRAVVAQVLTYAAYLHGMEPAVLEQQVLARHLSARGYTSLADAADASDQTGAFDLATFAEGLAESLAQGRFRLVFVLDEAPEELVRLVGYLETVSDKLLIDLVTVSAYQVNGSHILVPQRVDAEHRRTEVTVTAPPSRNESALTEGYAEFVSSISEAPEADRPTLQRLVEWAKLLQQEGLVTLATYRGTAKRWTLLPRLRADNVGLVTVWNERGGYISFYRSVFERRAPASVAKVEALIAPARLGKGTTTRTITEELLTALTNAYREAATGQLSG